MDRDRIVEMRNEFAGFLSGKFSMRQSNLFWTLIFDADEFLLGGGIAQESVFERPFRESEVDLKALRKSSAFRKKFGVSLSAYNRALSEFGVFKRARELFAFASKRAAGVSDAAPPSQVQSPASGVSSSRAVSPPSSEAEEVHAASCSVGSSSPLPEFGVFDLDYGEDQDYSAFAPVSVSYFEETEDVSSWIELYVAVCRLLLDDYPEKVRSFIGRPILGRGRYDFADAKFLSFMKAPARLVDFYVETDLSPGQMIARIRALLGHCNVDEENLVLRCRTLGDSSVVSSEAEEVHVASCSVGSSSPLPEFGVFDLDYGEDQDYSAFAPVSVSYFEETEDVSSWIELYVAVCRLLLDDYPEKVRSFIGRPILGRGRYDFADAKSMSFMKAPARLVDFYVETDLSPRQMIARIRALLGHCNVDEENLVLRCRTLGDSSVVSSSVPKGDVSDDGAPESGVPRGLSLSDFGLTDHCRFSPSGFRLFDFKPVRTRASWGDFYYKLCASIYSSCPSRFNAVDLLDFDDDGNAEIASERFVSRLDRPQCFANGLYVDVPSDGSVIISKSRWLLSYFGIDLSGLDVYCDAVAPETGAVPAASEAAPAVDNADPSSGNAAPAASEAAPAVDFEDCLKRAKVILEGLGGVEPFAVRILSGLRRLLRGSGIDSSSSDCGSDLKSVLAAVYAELASAFAARGESFDEYVLLSPILESLGEKLDGRKFGFTQAMLIRREYIERFGEYPVFDDDSLKRMLVDDCRCFFLDDCLFLPDLERDEFIAHMGERISDLVDEHGIVYADSFYKRMNQECDSFRKFRIFSLGIFVKFVLRLCGMRLLFRDGFFCCDYSVLDNRDDIVNGKIESFFLNEGRFASLDKLRDELWFFPTDEDRLRTIGSICRVNKNNWGFVENSPVFEHRDRIRDILRAKREENPSDSLSVRTIRRLLCEEIPYFEKDIEGWDDDKSFGSLVRSVFESDFPFERNSIAPLEGIHMNSSELVREFCAGKGRFTLEDCMAFCDDRGIKWQFSFVEKCSVPLGDGVFACVDSFVAEHGLTAGKIAEIDGCVRDLCDRDYFTVADFEPFLNQLPEIGVRWSAPVFSGYVSKISAFYGLCSPFTAGGFLGVVVRRDSGLAFADVLADALAGSSVDLESGGAAERALEFLFSGNYISRRGFDGIGGVVAAAIKRRGH